MKDEYFENLTPEERVPPRRSKRPLQEVIREHAAELESLGQKDRQLDQTNTGGKTSSEKSK